MTTTPQESALTRPPLRSYGIIIVVLAAAAWLHLGALLVTILFSLFALHIFYFWGKRWLALTLFLMLASLIFFGTSVFIHMMVREVPKIIEEAIPTVVEFAEKHDITLPFSDISDLKKASKEAAPKMAQSSVVYKNVVIFARSAAKGSIMVIAGIVIAMGIFLHREPKQHLPPNLYVHYYQVAQERFQDFFRSFERVMGAQLIISLINTVATAAFVLATPLVKFAWIIIPVTFFCGLLPIVGNLISNTLIFSIAIVFFSPHMAVGALLFLIIIHKLEYFLNSKIIGHRIRQPMWLTLIGLIVGEYLMGIPGVILAPVVLNYLKEEASRYAVPV